MKILIHKFNNLIIFFPKNDFNKGLIIRLDSHKMYQKYFGKFVNFITIKFAERSWITLNK